MNLLKEAGMEITKRKAAWDSLSKYDPLCNEDDVIEVTEWVNGEGFDIAIHSKNKMQMFNLTFGEIEALNYLIKSIDYNKD